MEARLHWSGWSHNEIENKQRTEKRKRHHYFSQCTRPYTVTPNRIILTVDMSVQLHSSTWGDWPEFAGAKERTRHSTQPCHATPLNSNPSLRGEWPESSSSLYGQCCQTNPGDSNGIKISKIRTRIEGCAAGFDIMSKKEIVLSRFLRRQHL